MSFNFTTLQTYNQGLQAYISGTPQVASGSVKEWIDSTLKQIPLDAQILEIGSGFGRDADYIESQGFRVQRSDAAESFVNHLISQGHEALQFNLLSDSFNRSWNLIFANAVFLHFNRAELENVLRKVHAALEPHGILSFSVKEGVGEGETNEKMDAPRYFCYWQQEPLEQLVRAVGFEILSSLSDGKFLQFILRRI